MPAGDDRTARWPQTDAAKRPKAVPAGLERLATAAGRDQLFSELYATYGPATYAFFVRRVGDTEWAADINQDLYLRLSRSLEIFEGRCSWRTWIFNLARKALADSRSQRWRGLAERSVSLDEQHFQEDLALPATGERDAEAALFRRRLSRCMKRLDELSRCVIVDHYFAGITLRELTEKLKLKNPSGSRALLVSGLRALKRCLQEGRIA